MIEAARTADGIVLGPVSHLNHPPRPRQQGGIDIAAELRIVLDLYANIPAEPIARRVPAWAAAPMDLVIARENAEVLYWTEKGIWAWANSLLTPDMALSLRKLTAVPPSVSPKSHWI